jgi:iron complex transport system substrate-binding protein
MAGRTVEVPDHVRRVATLGGVAVLNSFVFAFGKADTLVNDLPPNFTRDRWRFQYVFAPGLGSKPVVQGPEQTAAVEGVLWSAPDVVLAMDRLTVEAMARVGLPALYISSKVSEEVTGAMRLLGEVFEQPETAEAYRALLDGTLARVERATATLPAERRPRVLMASPRRMALLRLEVAPWIAKVGATSIVDTGKFDGIFYFSTEQLIVWDPDVLIVDDWADRTAVLADPKLGGLKAVKSGRIYVSPAGAHLWGHQTTELPLMMLWMAKTLHPDLFPDLDLAAEAERFYAEFYRVHLTPGQIGEILAGWGAARK